MTDQGSTHLQHYQTHVSAPSEIICIGTNSYNYTHILSLCIFYVPLSKREVNRASSSSSRGMMSGMLLVCRSGGTCEEGGLAAGC